MNLNDYFDPVSLEKPRFSHLNAESTFSRSITIHTPDNPISGIETFDIALFGVREDRNAFIDGSASAPDTIREKLYLLGHGHKKVRIIDLGNLKNTGTIEDSYFALRDILSDLMKNSVLAVIMGGSQDLGIGLSRAFEDFKGFWNYTTIDSRIDFGQEENTCISSNYLENLLQNKKNKKLNITNIGHQQYFTPLSLLDKFENKGHHSIRLGEVRADLSVVEPILRDTHILSVDLNAVRQPDAPAASSPSPNGFFGHEFCQLTRYAGASPEMKAVLFSELIPGKDLNDLSSHLMAQAIWYFLDGYSIRQFEDPRGTGMKKFIVSSSAADHNMIFYKSNQTDRWWMEIPVKDPVQDKNYIVACAYKDYQKACVNEIPDRWWKLMRRFS
jgi:arginase family enzyme